MEEYELIIKPFMYPINPKQEQNKIFFGEKNNRRCIYCGKTKDEVTFKKDAHVVPAALGNRILFNYNECDSCNEHFFGVYENELANYLMLDRIFIGARKRNGLPKYKPNPKGGTSIEHLPNSNTVSIKIDELEGKFEILTDYKNKEVIYKINEPIPYRPADICKALTHMIWPFLPEELRQKLDHIPKWLLGDLDIFPIHLDVAFVPGTGFSNVILECWGSTYLESKYPIMVRFTFGTKILSFYIPASVKNSEPPIRSRVYFQIPEHIEGLSVDGLTINDNNRLIPSDLTYKIKYTDITNHNQNGEFD